MLNYAAAPLFRSITRGTLCAFVTACALGLSASSALALDGIDLNSPAPPTAAGECSRLVQIKYPFLSCANGEIGQSAENETWANSRHLPLQGSWIEGPSYWGPTLNPVDYEQDALQDGM